jgi:hypothetical protein
MDHLATGQKSENTIKLPESDSKKDVGNDQLSGVGRGLSAPGGQYPEFGACSRRAVAFIPIIH